MFFLSRSFANVGRAQVTGMVRRLRLAISNAGGIPAADTLDEGLERVEDTILRAARLSESPSFQDGGRFESADAHDLAHKRPIAFLRAIVLKLCPK